MYKCKECGKVFSIHEKVRPDADIVYYPKPVTSYGASLIYKCPECKSTDITAVGFIQPSISSSN